MTPIEVICILDRSGSMTHIMDEAVGAFNNFIEDQKKLEGDVNVTLVAFDDQYEKVFDRVDIHEIPELTREMVRPRGMTAMYDAIGKALSEASQDSKTIVLIQTDGAENASREHNGAGIKSLIEQYEKQGWDFNFIGAGIDAVTAGQNFGMKMNKCFNIQASATGMENLRSTMSCATALYRSDFAPSIQDVVDIN